MSERNWAASFEDGSVNLELPKFSIAVFAPDPSRRGPAVKPLSMEEKFQRFVRNSYSSSALATTALSAHIPLSFGDEQQRNFAQRYAAAYADAQANAFFQSFLIPAVAHQDPRYVSAATGKFSHRLAYASTRILIGRSDNGANTFNTAAVAGAFVAAAVSNAYHPYHNRGVEGTLNRALGHLVSQVGMNILGEFWPDLRRKFNGRLGALLDGYQP